MKSLRSRAVVYGLVIVLGLLSALPNLLSHNQSGKLPDWYLQNTVSLGLDLQGGSHLLLQADLDDLFSGERQAIAEELARTLREAGIHYGRALMVGDRIEVPVRQSDQLSEAASLARKLAREPPDGSRRFDVDQNGGRLVLTLTEAWRENVARDAVERSLEVVRRRLDETGLVDPSITRQGSDGILVQMPGVADPSEIRKLLGTTAKMSFHWVAREMGEGVAVFSLPDANGEGRYQLEKRVAMPGERIRDAQMAFNPDTSEPVVNFKLDNEGARLFGDMTRDNIGRALAIVLDGKVITAPVIRSVIGGGSGEISGAFTTKEASNLALLLRAGALPAPLHVAEERTVGPDLGSDAIAMGLTTGLLGAAMVIAFMVGLYGRWGLIACVGLTVNVGLVFGVLSLLGATLTLPGIAGIILTIGMAVDANILINERIWEESRKGKPAWMALREGFGKAYTTILDSNVTTLIAVSLLFMVGSGPVRGFAVTIGIGLLTSLFTAIAVTRLIMEWRIRGRAREPLVISGIAWLDRLSERGVNFMRARMTGLLVSAVLSVAAIGLFVQPGLKYGVDFTGGTVVEVQAGTATVEQLRTTLQDHGLDEAAIQEFGADGRFLVRLPVAQGEPGATADQVASLKSAVTSAQPDAEFPRVDMVGPKVSGGFSDATILAVLLAGAGMLAYLWVRFESHFALAATLTIALDITKTIGFFALAGVEFNLTAVAALLALIGYSVNDKVVVFDRIRENLRRTPERPMLELLNDSISSTLTRTVFTSVTTFLALLPMGIAGGAAVASFALPMLFGIVIGTSSSVFIASSILYYLGQRRARKGLAQLRPSAEDIRKELEQIA
ncbi:protein translocase subunit SecD [Marinobacter sp. 71-i]|uniref:Multifunctional fusion protein n=1 Tax=Marinobacter iranensis TaxID=2962607 RepID=A0ABT5Y5R0_9GAMM|nr:protein translocase subunit SecD [Marinobacter iranensis]MDF0749013.1 protein translocase subunit SecD [Marinobacter iranensis]